MPLYEYYITKRTPIHIEANDFGEADEKAMNLEGSMREDKSTTTYHFGRIVENEIKLKNNGLGSLTQIADKLMEEMREEIKRNGYSNLTLNMEGAARGIYEIVELNEIKD